jgi:hypothetical protein
MRSKAIKKDPEYSVCFKKVVITGFNTEKKVVFFNKQKCNKVLSQKPHHAISLNDETTSRSYLKGSKLETTLNNLSAKTISQQKRVAPFDSDFSEFKISFQDQCKK